MMKNVGDPPGGSLPSPKAKSEAVGMGSTPTPATIPFATEELARYLEIGVCPRKMPLCGGTRDRVESLYACMGCVRDALERAAQKE
jgi:hypothetical protein